MRVYLYIIIIASLLTFCVRSAFPKDPIPIQTRLPIPIQTRTPTPTPTPSPTVMPTPSPFSIPTPAGDDGEEWLDWIHLHADFETWPSSNYDPVETRNGFDIRTMDIVVQTLEGDAAVLMTCGYNNIFYDDGSGDIRGLAFQGYIDIESTAIAFQFRLMDLLVPTVYAKSNKWAEVKAIKKLSKLQEKPKKPKKVKWTVDKGLKKKKEKYEKE